MMDVKHLFFSLLVICIKLIFKLIKHTESEDFFWEKKPKKKSFLISRISRKIHAIDEILYDICEIDNTDIQIFIQNVLI